VKLGDDPRQADLRARLRAWLSAHLPYEVDDDPVARDGQLRQWQRLLHEGGWMGLSWPVEYGGQGGDAVDQVVFNQELARAQAPSPPGIIGLQTLGPTLLRFGTEEQRKRYLPTILDATDVWCQGFSEPDAGSDLASLRTSAVLDGDRFIVNGQKVWTSYARDADWCALLVRTNADAAKHRGITYLVVDMTTQGITVRPIEQISGESEFNEVFFDDVAVPTENVIGEVDGGWHVAMSTLTHERATYVLSRSVELRIAFNDLVAQLGDLTQDAAARIGRCEVELSVLEAQSYSTLTRLQNGEAGDVSAVEKLLTSEVEQEVFSCGLDLLGPYRSGSPGPGGPAIDADRWVRNYLISRSATIHGGTAEVLRGAIAQRLLGMPRS
jgi:alkylation response protein AidB-like acyl-CoA dehydrogenase